ncbi:hypothetical protein pb186bvf_018830 [Paramecium bursaria]
MGNEKSQPQNNNPQNRQEQSNRQLSPLQQKLHQLVKQQEQNIQLEQLPNLLQIHQSQISNIIVKFFTQKYNSQTVNQNQLFEICDFLNNSQDHQYKNFPKLRKLELIFHMMGYDDQSKVPNKQIVEILEQIFNLCQPGSEKAATYLMNRIYDDTMDEEQRVGYLTNKLNQILPMLNDRISNQLVKYIAQIDPPQMKLNNQSEILDLPFLFLLSMNPILNKPMTLLYSTKDSGTSFNRLVWNILGYGGPTLLVVLLDKGSIVFGAYNPANWSDGLKFQGDSGCFLFSLSPGFKQFMSNGTQQNYCYLNTKQIDKSKYKVGMGFGGNNDHTSFRIWIDDEIETKSKVSSEDDTYQPGYLAGDIEGKINILKLEVWGLGGQQALEQQNQFRKERMEELERMRKVDKKAFFSGFDQAMFLEKTFAHKSQVREDPD